jgi:N-acetylglucosaminyl-diphospho-decaprenol L-rhamnosyltransferase
MPQDKTDIDVSVLIVNYNTAHLLKPMFDALEAAQGGLKLQPILVDNASRDGSVEYIRQHHPDVSLIVNDKNVGFGRANNQCLPHVQGRHVLLLNTDAFMAPDTLSTTVAYLDQHPEVGVVGVRLLGRDGTLQPSCRFFPTPLNAFLSRVGLQKLMPWVRSVDDMSWDHLQTRACDWVPGCYFLMRADLIRRIGLFDPLYFLYSEEVDLCKRIRAAGYAVHYIGQVSSIHIGGESAKSDGALSVGRQISALQIESELIYYRKHHGLIGVLLHAILGVIGDAVMALKGTIKGRPQWFATTTWQTTRETWRLLRATQIGLRPTR